MLDRTMLCSSTVSLHSYGRATLITQYLLDSGHGGQIKDKDGDEMDGYDEVIFPVDYQTAGCIVDDVRFPLRSVATHDSQRVFVLSR